MRGWRPVSAGSPRTGGSPLSRCCRGRCWRRDRGFNIRPDRVCSNPISEQCAHFQWARKPDRRQWCRSAESPRPPRPPVDLSRTVSDDGDEGQAEACDPVPRRGDPVPVAVAVPGAETVIKAACVFAAVTVAAAWQLVRLLRELEGALEIREGW